VYRDDSSYHSTAGYVHVGALAFTLFEIWDGVDRLERRGISLDAIAGALAADWETSVVALARIGRQR
jgi:hypothetical protein